MSVCIVSHDGELLLHRHMKAAPEAFLKAVAPDREGLVVAAECVFTWYWLADLCAHEGFPFVLGHARSMKALHGGTAKHDHIDAHKIAALLRGGMLPQAYGYPAQRRATRDLLRRRTPRMRQRAALLAHVPHTHSPYNLPESGKNIASKANRDGVAERLHGAAGQKTIAVDLALITSDDALLKDLERYSLNTATPHEAHTRSLLQTIPGIGKPLSRMLRYEMHQIDRFRRVQAFASYCRLVKCREASGGKRLGTAGKKSGHAHLKGGLFDAAALCLRNNPQGQKLLSRLEKTQDKGKALSILAHTLGRAIYDRLTRQTAFDLDLFLRS